VPTVGRTASLGDNDSDREIDMAKADGGACTRVGNNSLRGFAYRY
jgi:hypothetical protein